MALLQRSLTERVPAHGCGADTAQVGVALVAERPPTRRAAGDKDDAVVGAGGEEQKPPGGLPSAAIGEACRADLGAMGRGPAAGSDLPVRVPVCRVQAAQVEGGTVERGEGGGIHPVLVDAGEGGEARLRWLLARYPIDPLPDDAAESRHVDQLPAAVIFARMDDDWTEEALAEAGRYDARMRLKYMNRRRKPTPVTPTLEERRRAAIARKQRLELERLLQVRHM